MFLSFVLAAAGRGADALRNIKKAVLLHPHPSSYYLETLGLSHLALGDYDRAIAAFLRGIDINPSYMPCHYELAIAYGVRGRTEEAQAEAAIVKDDWPSVSADFILNPPLGRNLSPWQTGCRSGLGRKPYFKLGKLNSAPLRMPAGQRAVTVLRRV